MDEKNPMLAESPEAQDANESIFCDLFGRPENLLRLYRVLHPEDEKTQMDDLRIIALTSIFQDGIHNELGFVAGDRLLYLLDEQDNFSQNVMLRIWIFMAETYAELLEDEEESSSGAKKLPKPEFYMIYTGEREDHPEVLSFRKDMPGMAGSFADLEVKVIYGSVEGDILDQYIAFSKIFAEQTALYGKSQKAKEEIFKLCRERNVLQPYLAKEEVEGLMDRVFKRMSQ